MHLPILCSILLNSPMEDIEFKWQLLPEFPQIDEPSQFLVRVTEGFDFEDVDRFTMGMKIFL